MLKKIYYFLLFTLIFTVVSGQQNSLDVAKLYFEEGQYSIAQSMLLKEFADSDDIDGELLYFIANCSKELSNIDSKYWYSLLIEGYEYSNYIGIARKDLAFIYFTEKEYEMSAKLLSEIEDASLKNDEYHFKLGYSLFMNENFDDAKYHFSKVKNNPGKYKTLSLYYYAHISYTQKLYNTSLTNFEFLQEDKIFGDIVPYYIAQIYFSQRRYDELIDYVVPVLENVISSRKEEVNRMLAESYYQLSNFEDAEKYLKQYIDLIDAPEMIDYFQLGQINMFLEDYTDAIVYLEKVQDVSDSLSQYSSYYLGQSYIKRNKKNFALQAFRKSADVDFDLDMKEEALYNYFKLSYELDLPYSNLTDVMDEMKKFHFTKYQSEVERLMINIFQMTNQYQEAFDFLQHNHLPEKEERETLQRLAYYIGVQHYNNANYNNSLLMFEYSRRYPENKEIDAMCIYWLADCYFQLKDYTGSISNYKAFLETPSKSLLDKMTVLKYNLAYAYFQSSQYNSSIEYFRKSINSDLDNSRKNDAYLRIADSYYMMSDFRNARRNYKKAAEIGLFDEDYALYQQSKCSDLLSDYKEQEKVLLYIQSSFQNSVYNSKVLLDLANLYRNLNQNEKAISYYDKILNSSSNEDILSSSLLNKGLIYYNSDEYEESIKLMKIIIIDYSQTQSFKEAKIGLKDAYLQLGDIDAYLAFINTIPEINITLTSKDSLTYQSAYNKYKKEDYVNAKIDFETYLSAFGEESIFLMDSYFYLSESYWNTKDTIKAINGYKKIFSFDDGEYIEPSTIKLSRYSYSIADYKYSNIYYQKLDSIASNNSLKRESIIRLMFGYEEINSELAVKYAERVLLSEKVDDRLLAKAKIIIARLDFESGNFSRSYNLCNEIVDLTTNTDGSEAMYMKSYFSYLEEDYETTEELIFLMADQYSSNHWIAKGFILLSDVYLRLDNNYQAKATLESVIENHDEEDVVNEAREKWEKIIIAESEKINIKKSEATIEIGDTLDYEINYEELDIDIEQYNE